MAWAKEIKRKITSIKNTSKITKAMELISTVKMKKSQDLTLDKKDFVFEMLKIFIKIDPYLSDYPLFSPWKWEKTLAVIITSNKWLCWGYNVNVMKKVNSYIKETKEELEFISVWKKWALFIARTWNKLLADFSREFSDNVNILFTRKISVEMRKLFLIWWYKKVVVFYNHYVNTIVQKPQANIVLPIWREEIKKYLIWILWKDIDLEKELSKETDISSYTLEPSIDEIAWEVIPVILDMMFFDIILSAKASEHSSRMIAMKNAKDSANKIASRLTLKYNNARQALITREVSEITAWVESMK